MSPETPKIKTLNPIVYPDNRRVMLELTMENLPTIFSNVAFAMPDLSPQPQKPARPDPNTPSPYPNIELSILNSRGQQAATLFIVEHKEEFTSLTLHLRQADVNEQYTARAEMTYQDETIDVMEVPFRLGNGN